MMNAKITSAILVSLLASASAVPVEMHHASALEVSKAEKDWAAFASAENSTLEASEEHLVPMPMHAFGDTCGADAHLRIKPGAAALLQEHNVPGAGVDGMDKLKPFKKVLKDGFLFTGCVKDYMYYRGDKFGDNKVDYKLNFSRVSIVHYDAFVAKEDRDAMTHKKCFEFCRTVPNMGFFGIVNGRGCYCTPYYQPMESDDSQCNAVCEGDNSVMCGGKSKSSVFAMHMCESTKADLSERVDTANDVKKRLRSQEQGATSLSKQMQGFAVVLQKSFGQVGDSAATGHMQEAKAFAGKLIHKAEDTGAVADKLDNLVKQASGLKGFAKSDTVTKAERIMEDLDETMGNGEATSNQLLLLTSAATGHGVSSEEEPKQVTATDYANGDWEFTVEFSFGDGTTVSPGQTITPELIAAAKSKAAHGAWAYLVGSLQGGRSYRRTGPMIQRKKKFEQMRGYYPVMYFVDKKFEAMPTTCDGARVAQPIVGKSMDECAAACDANVHSCVAFQHFKKGNGQLCFLLSGFSTGSYYTGCDKAAFLQGSAAPFDAKCFAKLSKFEGVNLKPNPSGKCAECFKQLKKADRCYA